MTSKELFLKAYELISVPERWGKKHLAKNKYGKVCHPDNELAVCWCSSGAILAQKEDHQIKDIVIKALNKTCKVWVADFNDTHTHAEVMAMWRQTGKREGWL